MGAAYYKTFGGFLEDSIDNVLGCLAQAAASAGPLQHWNPQTTAWREQLEVLQSAVKQVTAKKPEASGWSVHLEYAIPRRQRRIDAVILAGGAIVPIEFKSGSSERTRALWQVREYALDLRDFHSGSRDRPIFPIVVLTEAEHGRASEAVWPAGAGSGVHEPLVLNPGLLPSALLNAGEHAQALGLGALAASEWDQAEYRPALNIIEAAAAIFAGHHVREIAHAAAENVAATVQAIFEIATRPLGKPSGIVCFVTGVPGSGKTLVGLATAHALRARSGNDKGAVFLSGNGPLVRIIREALARDASARRGTSKGSAKREISALIQNVHEFLRHYTDTSHPPAERVVVFDEAQRAWSAEWRRRKGRGDASEPSTMLDIMERSSQPSVVIALVGPGQEIHYGEAGVAEWGRALVERAGRWQVVASPEALAGGEGMGGQQLFGGGRPRGLAIEVDERLHLRSNIRSFRARLVGDWTDAVLSGDPERAASLFADTSEFPVVLTRELEQARAWLRARREGETLAGATGLLASSGAIRLRAYGLELCAAFRRAYPFEHWFLAPADDVRSSSALEVAATEFECQGLELDWPGICWGDDVTYAWKNKQWHVRRFTGSGWANVSDPATRQLILNKYRVLLTRARKGMVIWVPKGDPADPTRDPYRLDQTAEFLRACGIPELRDAP